MIKTNIFANIDTIILKTLPLFAMIEYTILPQRHKPPRIRIISGTSVFSTLKIRKRQARNMDIKGRINKVKSSQFAITTIVFLLALTIAMM
ncbi:MAG: hypothetical protein GX877_03820 [Bacteroidales bacterium]|nr:hypothetical protein [Bacteroidales bacterium]